MNELMEKEKLDLQGFGELENDFKIAVSLIKQDIRSTQMKTMLQVNSNLIMLYFRIGKILEENSRYGNGFIKNLAMEIKLEFPNLDGFGDRNLRNMKLFYQEYQDDEIWQQLVAKLPWGQNMLLIQKLKDKKIRMIYAKATIENGWSRSILDYQIQTQYHKRIGNSFNNFSTSLPPLDSDFVNNVIKDPYIFDFITLKQNYKEKELEKAMIEKIKKVLLELGKGFSFVGNQYKVNVGNNDYYLDLLFYHLELRCYIVIELKATGFKPEYVGQINFYINAVNHLLKKEYDNNTIGLLLCKEKDKLLVEWSLDGISNPIGVSSFELDKYIPKDILEKLPTEEELNLHIDMLDN